MNFFEIIEKGGILMYPIIFCSVASFAILFERLWFLRKKNIIFEPKSLFQVATAENGVLQLLEKTADKTDIFSKTVHDFLSDDSQSDIEEIASMYAKANSTILYSNISITGTMATISPLLGLLGTVLGMIRMFTRFSGSGGSPEVMAAGIWEALITTAAGLIVAIPSLIIYRYLISIANKRVEELEFNLRRLLSYIKK